MEINNMTLEEIEARLAEINEVVEQRSGEELDALKAEVVELQTRKAELIEIETRKEQALELQDGAKPEKVIEERKELKPMEERTFGIDTVEYREAWLKNMMGAPIDAEARTALSAAAVIPTETLNQIVTRIQENPLLAKIDLMQMPNYIKIPVYSTNAGASWTGTSTDSADEITPITLNAYQLIKTIEVPATVEHMSISAFESYLVKALANKIEIALQAAVIAGTGADNGQPTGILTTISSATGTFTNAAATKKDLLTIMGSLPADYQNGACWIMPSAVFYGEVMNISNHDSFVNVNNGFEYKLFGKDVILDDNCIVTVSNTSTDNILYGNPKAYHMNMGEKIDIAKDTSVGFRSNSTVYRAVCLADGKLDNAAAFVRYARHA